MLVYATHTALDNMEGWRQFASVQIEFHERATIITGANGSGKTTLLSILSQHFGWSPAFIGTLRIDSRGARRYFSGFFSDFGESNADVGRLIYDDGTVAALQAPMEGASFQVRIHPLNRIPGIYITSHRPVYTYQAVEQIPTKVEAREELFQQYLNTIRQSYQPGGRFESPSYRLKHRSPWRGITPAVVSHSSWRDRTLHP